MLTMLPISFFTIILACGSIVIFALPLPGAVVEARDTLSIAGPSSTTATSLASSTLLPTPTSALDAAQSSFYSDPQPTSIVSTVLAGQEPTVATTNQSSPSVTNVPSPGVSETVIFETVTEIVTVTVVATPSATASPSIPISWTMPTDISDLTSFNIRNFADGTSNIAIVTGVPAAASATFSSLFAAPTPTTPIASEPVDNAGLPLTPTSNSSGMSLPLWDNSSAVLQLFYPQGSSDPANSPVGGADFYASPIPLSNSTNVTLEYSVFFPIDFDFRLGGKLPGLYGGHDGCSGGTDAENCFSTRLMWRKDGMGELYLYAPKAEQTEVLCSTPPRSICDSADGLSIGRGSFNFTRGQWNIIRQTVTLNTPGVADGSILIEVNGQLVLNSSEVYYRHATNIQSSPSPAQSPTDGGDGGLLAGILLEMDSPNEHKEAFFIPAPSADGPSTMSDPLSPTWAPPMLLLEASRGTRSPPPSRSLRRIVTKGRRSSKKKAPVAFEGLFFSTFFGGQEGEWATKRDTWTWFKDFAVTINE